MMRIRMSTELHRNVDDAVRALRADANVYVRAGKLVHVVNVTRDEAKQLRRIRLLEGTPLIRDMAPATLRARLTRVAQFEKLREKNGEREWVAALPSDAIVQAVHAQGEYRGLRPVLGIVEAPFLRPDGSVCQEPGYDDATGYVYVPGQRFKRVPDWPTAKQASAAFRELSEIFVDFPYVNAAHAAVPIAAILTLLARPAIEGSVPCFLFDASMRGSGKSKQEDATAIVATGRGAPRMNYPGNDEELEKVLGGYALRGAGLIVFDNVARPFGGGPLDRVLTARDTVELRVLGQSKVPTLWWLAVVLASGNNLVLCGDTARRVLKSRIEPTEEKPEARTDFRHPDLIRWVSENRARLVVAALTILRAYAVAKRPDMGCAVWGSFEEWSGLIPHAIVFAGGADPMLARPAHDAEVDPDAAALACFVEELPRLDPEGKGMTSKEIIAALYHDEPDTGAFDDLREAIETWCPTKPGIPPSTRKLGTKLATYRGHVVGGAKLESTSAKAGVERWHVVPLAKTRAPAPRPNDPPNPPNPPRPATAGAAQGRPFQVLAGGAGQDKQGTRASPPRSRAPAPNARRRSPLGGGDALKDENAAPAADANGQVHPTETQP